MLAARREEDRNNNKRKHYQQCRKSQQCDSGGVRKTSIETKFGTFRQISLEPFFESAGQSRIDTALINRIVGAADKLLVTSIDREQNHFAQPLVRYKATLRLSKTVRERIFVRDFSGLYYLSAGGKQPAGIGILKSCPGDYKTGPENEAQIEAYDQDGSGSRES